ncbi:GAF domain-containing SpoIIE family protein phosphatase [Streptomyces sp. NPDC046977]|uniref:PP2C family protein-serine/threonine phosphatase n=1 Tax=Streptomyces sp. NPDC046977 TaxID=3154703 RepID=UPI0033CE4CE9
MTRDGDRAEGSPLGPGVGLGGELEQIAEQLVLLARVQERLHDLYEAALSRDVDLPAVLRLIVTTAMDLVGARYGALGVLDQEGTGLADFIEAGLTDQQLADITGVPFPQGRGLLGRLIHDPAPLRVDSIAAHPDSAGFPPGHPPMHTLLGVAIHIRGQIYGDLYVADRLDGNPFTTHDETVILALAGAAGLAIDDARMFRQIRDEAEQFQRLLVPRLSDLSPFQAAAAYRPAPAPGLLGGDWYDALRVSDDTCVAVIGDVLGHDVRAAAAMSQTRHMLRALLYDRGTSPSDVLARLDRALQAITDTPVTTACLARLEPAAPGSNAWTLRWSSAGHCSPLLITPGGDARYLAVEPDLPLGVDTTTARRDHTHQVPAGSTLILFTDGLIEYPRQSLDTGLERLRVLATRYADLPLHRLVHALTEHHPSDGHDDMAVLALRTPPHATPS